MSRSVLDIEILPVPIETELWGRVYVRRAMTSELEAILSIIEESKGPERLVRLAQLGACDSGGVRLFTEADRSRLMAAPLEPISDIALGFLEANGLGEAGAEKKSSPPSSGSPFISHMASAARIRP